MSLLSVATIMFIRGRIITLLTNLEVPWPLTTTLALNITVPIAMTAVFVTTIIVELVAKHASTKNNWNAAAILVTLIGSTVFLIGVAQPIVQVIRLLSGNKM